MFGITGFASFVAASVLLHMTPGIDTFYILGKSLAGGRKIGILSALGISTGILVHTIMVSFGLSIILSQSATAFNILKIAGAAYLIIMGIKSILSKNSISLENTEEKKESPAKIYTQGILTNVLNPKVALFFLAFLPQFVDPSNTYGTIPFLILGITFFCTSTIWCTTIALLASFISRGFQKSAVAAKISGKIAGVIYIGLGLAVLRAKLQN